MAKRTQNHDDGDLRAKQKLGVLKERMKEWVKNDYIADEDLNNLDFETFEYANELLQTDPENNSLLDKEDAERLQRQIEETAKEDADRAAAAESADIASADDPDAARQAAIRNRRPKQLSFDELVENKDSSSSSSSSTRPPDPVPTRKTNLIQISDPDDLLIVEHVGERKPQEPSDEFLLPNNVRDDNPGCFLPDPAAYLALDSVRNLEQFLNIYRVHRSKRTAWSESKLRNETFEVDLKRYVRDFCGVKRSAVSLIFVAFLESPIFVYCVFERRRDLEKPNTLAKDRVYSWAGHRFTTTVDANKRTGEETRNQPSAFVFHPHKNNKNEDGWM